jgi:hypothetical protein
VTASTNTPAHARARWVLPHVYSASVADPPPRPRPVVLRSSCGHALGVGVVGRRQRYLAWATCSRGRRPRRFHVATVSVEPTMPRAWRIRANDLSYGGIGLRLPEYAPMGARRATIALTVLWRRSRSR